MPTHFLPLLTGCGGIGVITPTDGEDILIMAGAGITGMVQVGDSAGAAGMAAAGGDITTIIIRDGIRVVDMEVVIGRVIHILTVVLRERAVIEIPLHLPLCVEQDQL